MKYFIKWEYWNVNEYFYRDVYHPGGLQLHRDDCRYVGGYTFMFCGVLDDDKHKR